MKIYTEEQVREALNAGFRLAMETDGGFDDYIELFINSLTPIELPSDEEIDEMGKDVIIYNDTKRGWFVEGLKFMRDKIGDKNEI